VDKGVSLRYQQGLVSIPTNQILEDAGGMISFLLNLTKVSPPPLIEMLSCLCCVGDLGV